MDTNYLKYGKKYKTLDSGIGEGCGCGGRINRSSIELGGQAQLRQADVDETKLFCVTVSCCSFGLFTIEVASFELCHSVTSSRVALTIDPPTANPELDVLEDSLLPGLKSKSGNGLIMPKGRYRLSNNNEITFTPVEARQEKEYCYVIHAEGTILGHEFNYTLKYCVSWVSASRTAAIVISPNINPKDLAELLASSKREVTFNRDIHIYEPDVIDIIVHKGNYYVNNDGKIYLQNVPIKC